MLNFRPQGGNDVARAIAAAYQTVLVPGAQITGATAPDKAVDVFSAIHNSRGPVTGRQLKLMTGYRGDHSNVDDKIRQWRQLRDEMATPVQGDKPPRWLRVVEPPAWLNQ